MQPPERKSKQPLSLKVVHLEHCGRIQQKYQQDVELLDDIRIFMRQRTVIEKLYAQSLCKLAQQLLSKRQLTIPDLSANVDNDQQSNKRTCDVWRCVLEETEKVGQTRLEAAETCLQRISEDCKQLKNTRSQAVKTVLQQLADIQKELSSTAHELNKSQKLYREEQHLTHEARLKAASANAKLKNKSLGRFMTLNKLQQQNEKYNVRWESCETQSTEARNQYLLNLAATNSHLQRYYNTDVPELLKLLDGDYYEKLQEFIQSLATMEQNCSNYTLERFNRVKQDATKISRDFSIQCFLQEKPVLNNIVQYQFDPQDNDEVRSLSCSHGGDLVLSKEARKWASKVVRETRTIRSVSKQLNTLQEQLHSGKTFSNSVEGVSLAADLAALELKCNELRNEIRRAETGKLRAEARLELLRQGGVNVDEWLNESNVEVDSNEDGDSSMRNGRCSPCTSNKSDVSEEKDLEETYPGEVGGAPQPNRRTSYGFPADSGDTIGSGVVAGEIIQEEYTAVDSYPVWCVVLYDYKAVNDDELSIEENENLEIIGAGDGDGWLKARNSRSEEGLVAENYIRVWNPVDDIGENDANEINVDGYVDEQGYIEYHPDSSHSSNNEGWAKAMFAYTASCDEELSFTEGEVIHVKSKEPNGVDDGWWVGEVHGSVGVFPSLMVQELTPDNTLDKTLQNGLHRQRVDYEQEENDSEQAEYQLHTDLSREFVADNVNNVNSSYIDQSYQHSSEVVTNGQLRSGVNGSRVGSSASMSHVGVGSNARSVLDLQYLFTEGAESCV